MIAAATGNRKLLDVIFVAMRNFGRIYNICKSYRLSVTIYFLETWPHQKSFTIVYMSLSKLLNVRKSSIRPTELER